MSENIRDIVDLIAASKKEAIHNLSVALAQIDRAPNSVYMTYQRGVLQRAIAVLTD